MLNFYTDSAMTKPIGSAYPKRICIPSSGGSKIVEVYLGDPYKSTLSANTTSGEGTVHLTDTSEFLSTGTARLAGVDFTYTGKTISTLTGCSGTPVATNGSTIIPHKRYIVSGNIEVFPAFTGFTTEFNIQLATNYPTTSFGFAQNGIIYSSSYIDILAGSVTVFIQANVVAGSPQEFINWGLATSGFAVRDISDYTTAIDPTEGLIQPFMYGYVYRDDQSPVFNQRVFQLSRKITNLNPGFTVGSYRWQDEDTINGFGFIPPNWTLNPVTIGAQKFVSGIGYGNDLEMTDVVSVITEGTSIYPEITNGQYFYGPYKNYLPASPVIDILDATVLTHTLTQTPKPQMPIQIGYWDLNPNNAYIPQFYYTYAGVLLNPDGSPRTDLPAYYFSINRSNSVVTLSQTLPIQSSFVGALSGTTSTFKLPGYPITDILSAYANYGGSKPNIYSTVTNINTISRTVTVTIPGGNIGDPIFITYTPRLMCLYDTGGESRIEESVDLNPAVAGIAQGYYYIEHRSRTLGNIQLIADKPEEIIPPSFSATAEMVAYGPVYFKGDYVVLTGSTYSVGGQEVMPGLTLNVLVDADFTGQINYQNPQCNAYPDASTVTVVTGGDGKVNFIYTPDPNGLGFYTPISVAYGSLSGMATTTVTNDTIVLPEPVPLSQILNVTDGWMVYTYQVMSNQPFYGQVGANTALGEVPWATTGTIGTTTWKTNGMIVPFYVGSEYMFPIDAKDSSGYSYTNMSFNGNVSKLVYPTTLVLSDSTTVGALYVNMLQRVTIQLQDPVTGIYSNPVLLQMQTPSAILESQQWLVLNNATTGILNQFRLGWTSSQASS